MRDSARSVAGSLATSALGSLASLLFAVLWFPSPVDAVNYVINPGESIRAVLVNAVAGDTVFVNPGTYEESQYLPLFAGVVLTGSTENRDDVEIRSELDVRVFGVGNEVRHLTLRPSITAFGGSGGALTLFDVRVVGGGEAFDAPTTAVVAQNCEFAESFRGGETGALSLADCAVSDMRGFTPFGDVLLERCAFSRVRNGLSVIEQVVEIRDCSFEGCFEEPSGSAFFGQALTQARVTNSSFRRLCGGNGAAIGLRASADIAIVDCFFEENGGFDGGSIYVDGCEDVLIEHCAFAADSCRRFGGSLHLNSVRNTIVDGCTFDRSEAELGGGGMSASGDGVEIRNCRWTQCRASRGGGLYFWDDVRVVNCEWESCTSDFDGGAVLADGAGGIIEGGRIERCTAVDFGGALAVRQSVTLQRVEIHDCSARQGAAVSFQSDSALEDVTVSDCVALEPGGGAFLGVGSGATLTLTRGRIIAPMIDGQVPFALFSRAQVEVRDSYLAYFSELFPSPGVTYSCCSFFPVEPRDRGSIAARADWLGYQAPRCGPLAGVPENSVAAGRFGCDPMAEVGCTAFGVYVQTSPPGLPVRAAGSNLVGGAYVSASPGQSLDLSVDQVIQDEAGRFTFESWSDGRPRDHTATVSSYDDVFVANFTAEYRILVDIEGEGDVTPGGVYFPLGSLVPVQAVGDPGWIFDRWETPEGDLLGDANPDWIVIDGRVSRRAVFVPGQDIRFESVPPGVPVTIDGQSEVLPFEADWDFESEHLVLADTLVTLGAGKRGRFEGWRVSPFRNFVVVVGEEAVRDTVDYSVEYELTVSASEGGAAQTTQSWYETGAQAQVTAIRDDGFVFEGWIGTGEGSYTGPDNPAIVTLNGPVEQHAIFRAMENTGGYELRLSASDSDPFVQLAAPTDSLRQVYLWLQCAEPGMTAMEAGVEADFPVFAFTPTPGVLNVGSATELLLAVGGCPIGPSVSYLLGSFLVLDFGGSICLRPSAANDVLGLVDCDALNPRLIEDPAVFGFASVGAGCETGTNGCEQPISVRLSQLRAEAGDRKVHVRWQTTSEVDHAGFRIYRSAGINGPWDLISGEELFVGASPYDFADGDVLPDRRYFYEIGAVDIRGHEDRYGPVEITTPQWRQFVTALAPIRPNPFVRETDIAFSLAAPGPAKLEIFDVTGRLVRRLVNGVRPAGEHVATWDGRDGQGRVVPAGVYFSRFEAGGVQQSKKIVRTGTR